MARPDQQTVLPSQAQQAADVIRTAGFEPSQFAWSEMPSGPTPGATVSRLTHVPSGYFFQFDFSDHQHYSIFAPGEDKAVDYAFPGGWQTQLNYFAQWAQHLRRELSTVDPWAQFFSAADLIEEGQQQTADNTPFSDAEYHDVVRRLELVREFLLERSDDESARERTNAKIDYLVTQARSSGRSQWFYMAMGVLLSEIVSRALSSEDVRRVFELLVRGVQQLTGG